MSEPDSIQLMISAQTALTALIVAYVAVKQWMLAQDRFKLDLFEKRYKVFAATRAFLVHIVQESTFRDIDLIDFSSGTADADFLFKNDIIEALQSIHKRALVMRSYRQNFSDLRPGDERTRLVELATHESKFLTNELRNLKKTFHPYLGFGKWQ